MTKLQIFEVVLEGDNVEVFQPGDWVKGYIRIQLAATKRDIRGIYIKFQGKAKTKWHESEGTGRGLATVRYTSKEVYFEETLLIFGGERPTKKLELEPGDHRFPFRFYIPAAPLPLPFESQYGYIRYKLKATIDRPWRFNHVTKRMFSITGVELDLNRLRPTLGMPHKAGNVRETCCFCCEASNINMVVQINKAGLVPGELLWIHAAVENLTRKDILAIRAKLKHRIIITGQRHGVGDFIQTKVWTELIAYVDWGGCRARSSMVDRRPLRIPPCAASTLLGCNIMKVEYFLEFVAEVKGPPTDHRIILPLIIGTIPLRSAYAVSRASREVVTQQPAALSTILQFPPPTYEVSVGGFHEIPSKSGYDYTFGKLLYAPRYIFYNLHSPRSPQAPEVPPARTRDLRDKLGDPIPPTPSPGMVVELPEDMSESTRSPHPTELMLDSPISQSVPPTTQPNSPPPMQGLVLDSPPKSQSSSSHTEGYPPSTQPGSSHTQQDEFLSHTQGMTDFSFGACALPVLTHRMSESTRGQSSPELHSPSPTEELMHSPSTPGLPPKTFRQMESYHQGEVPPTTSAPMSSFRPDFRSEGVPPSTQPYSPYTQHSTTSSSGVMSPSFAQHGSPTTTAAQGLMVHYAPSGRQEEPREESIGPRDIEVNIEYNPSSSYN